MAGNSLIVIIAMCAIACGSKSLSAKAANIREGADADLTDCTYLQKVQGTASENDSNAATHAKNQAKEAAAAIGATHIKWIVPCCTSVEADAYRCDLPD